MSAQTETTTKPKLLKDWNFNDFKTINRHIVTGLSEYLRKKGMDIPAYKIEDKFGLAYTSSGDFAGLWNCNGYKLEFNDIYKYFNGIVIDENLQSYLCFEDEKENNFLDPFILFAHPKVEVLTFATNELNKFTNEAFYKVNEYLKTFEGKKILTNSGLSKKIELPQFTVKNKTKYGFIDIHFWTEQGFDRIFWLKTKLCINGGGYPHENNNISTYYCEYMQEFAELGEINKEGIFIPRKTEFKPREVLNIKSVNDSLYEIKKLNKEIENLNDKIKLLKSNLPQNYSL